MKNNENVRYNTEFLESRYGLRGADLPPWSDGKIQPHDKQPSGRLIASHVAHVVEEHRPSNGGYQGDEAAVLHTAFKLEKIAAELGIKRPESDPRVGQLAALNEKAAETFRTEPLKVSNPPSTALFAQARAMEHDLSMKPPTKPHTISELYVTAAAAGKEEYFAGRTFEAVADGKLQKIAGSALLEEVRGHEAGEGVAKAVIKTISR